MAQHIELVLLLLTIIEVVRGAYQQSPGWLPGIQGLGQITAVDINADGNVVIFHRGDHVWGQSTFDYENRYTQVENGPISTNTIIILDPHNETVLDHWGKDLFYLPHGLSFDKSGNVWITDVALHQVFKFSPDNRLQAKLELGVRFKPGSDNDHFCKPTSVAVDDITGEFYVADGYCNSRILRFSASGSLLGIFGTSDLLQTATINPMDIPHKIILIEQNKLACVADRERGRVLCFSYPDGTFKYAISSDEVNPRFFSISYAPCEGGIIYGVSGPELVRNGGHPVTAFTVNATTRALSSTFAPKQTSTFSQPHDIVATKDCHLVFIVEIGPNNIYKFQNDDYPASTRKVKLNSAQVADTSGTVVVASQPTSTSVVNKEMSSSASTNSSSASDFLRSSSSLSMALLAVPLLLVIIFSIYVGCKKDNSLSYFSPTKFGFRSKNREHFDLGRLLSDPEKSGFNRVAMDESDIDVEVQSDSEVEEFNIKSARKA